MQNISLFHLFIVDIQPRVLRPLLPHPYFDHAQPNIFQSIFNYPEFVSTCKKSDYLIILTHFPNYQAKKIFRKSYTAQKMKFSIKDVFSKSDQIRSFLWIWSHLLKKSLMENLIFCTVLLCHTELHMSF